MSGSPRLLVTGATGMLGCTLVPAMVGAGCNIVNPASAGDGRRSADLTDRRQTHEMLDAAAPDVIINLVGLTNVDMCEEVPDQAYKLNVLAVENICSWRKMASHDCHLIQISTDQVYDGAGVHREDDVTILNTYALSKYAGELAAQRVPATILRTNFFGPSAHASRRSLSDWIGNNLRSNQSFTVFDDVMFSPLTMATLSRMIVVAVRARIPGIFNLGSRDGLSKADFAALVARRLGYDPAGLKRGSAASVNLRAVRPTNMRMCCDAFESAFGLKLPTLSEEIDHMETTP